MLRRAWLVRSVPQIHFIPLLSCARQPRWVVVAAVSKIPAFLFFSRAYPGKAAF